MTDREKVIKELAVRIQSDSDKWDTVVLPIKQAKDILALLKEQEPRVITREELKQFEGSPCWFESSGTYIGKEGFWIIPVMFHTFFAGTIMYYTSVVDGVADCGELGLPAYNKSWRCWTAKPTDEQRKAVKWE